MNILLNNYCNQACEYCFANKVLQEDHINMKMEDFRWLLEFLKRSNEHEVRLIGGEPTLHPLFKDIFLEASQHNFVDKVLVFTNGTFNEGIGYIMNLVANTKRVALLVNLNHPSMNGHGNKVVYNNLDYLSGTKVQLTLGINFFKEDQDYGYLIDAIRRYNVKSVRWSVTVPNTEEKRTMKLNEYFPKFIPVLKEFVTDLAKEGVHSFTDCNNIPTCMIDDATLRYFAMLSLDALEITKCSPVIDVKPTMKAIRCFGMGGLEVDIKNFENRRELDKYFKEKVDKQYEDVPIFEECKQCAAFQVRHRSCTCLSYREGEKK